MYPLNDNDLDRLSREAAEQYDVDKNPSTSGWEALEGRLNKEMPVDEKKRRRFLFWLFFIAATAGGGLWYIMAGNDNDAGRIAHVATVPTNTNNDAKNNPQPGETISPNPVKSQPETGVGTEPTQPTATDKPVAAENASPAQQPKNAQPAATVPVQPGLATSTEPNADKPTAGKAKAPAGYKRSTIVSPRRQQAKSTAITNDDLVIAGTAATQNKNNKAANKKNNSQSQGTTQYKKETDPVDPTDDKRVAVDNVDNQQQATPVAAAKTGNSTNPTDTASVAKTTKPEPAVTPAAKDTTATAAKTKQPKKTDNKKVKGFEIGLVVGPDASNVKFYDAGHVGFNAGLQVGYRFSDRWAVNTGLIYTRKNYVANGKDIKKYGYFAQPEVKVNTMEGYCTMWDIPLNVRYDFSVNNKRRFFASTGFSTYIMNRENYDYYYTRYGVNNTANWDSKDRGIGDSTYLFSILNLSAGFERMINKKFSIQAEPYFKLPLSQLGHGKLNLNSYGIYFSVKYRIAK